MLLSVGRDLAPADHILSCPRKKGRKEGVLRSLAPQNSRRALGALRSNNCGESDGRRLACSWGCALTDALLGAGCFALLRRFRRWTAPASGVPGCPKACAQGDVVVV